MINKMNFGLLCLVFVSTLTVQAQECFNTLMQSSTQCSGALQRKMSEASRSGDKEQARRQLCSIMDEFINCMENTKVSLKGCPGNVMELIDKRMWEERENARNNIGCGAGAVTFDLFLLFLSISVAVYIIKYD